MVKGLIKDVFIYGAAGAVAKALHFFLVPLYTRLFLPSEYGIVDLVTVITGIFSLMATIQMESAMGRFYSEANDISGKNEVCSTGLLTVVVSSTLMFLIFNLSSVYFSTYFLNGLHRDTLTIASCTIILSAIYGYFINLLRFIRKPLLYASTVILQITATVITILWLVIDYQMGIKGIFYGQIVGFSLAIALLIILARREKLISLRWNKEMFRQLLKFGLPLLPAVLMGGSVTFISRFFMLDTLTLSEIGLYSMAMKIASVMMLLDEAIRMTWAPFLYENIKKDNYKSLLKRIFVLSSLTIFSIVLIVWMLLAKFIHVFVDESYMGTLFISMILVLDFGLKSIVQLLLVAPVILKKTVYNSIITLIGLTAYVIALIVMIPMFGLNGAALSSLVSTLVILVFSWIITERLYYVGHSLAIFSIPLIILLSILFFKHS